jgi:hypothetical protein
MIEADVGVVRGEPLTEAFGRVRDAFMGLGYDVEMPGGPLGDSDFAPHFRVAPTASSAATIVVVVTEPWSDERARTFLDAHLDLLESETRAVWIFRSAWPLHPAVAYMFSPRASGRLEAAALSIVTAERLTVEAAESLGEQCRGLVQAHCGLVLDLDDVDCVRVLDSLVSNVVRSADPDLAVSAGSYCPLGILALVGAAFGEVIRRQRPGAIQWSEPPDYVEAVHPVLRVASKGGEAFLLPVDRVFRCFQEGSDRSLRSYFDVVVGELLSGDEPVAELGSWGDAADQLIAMLKPAGWRVAATVVRRPLLPGGPVNTPLVVPAVDLPTRVSFLLTGQIDSWGSTVDEVMDRAISNIEAMSPALEDHLLPLEADGFIEVVRLSYDDYFNASRALIAPALFRAASRHLSAAESFLLAVPNRDILLISPDGSAEEFARFQSLVRWFHERQPGPVSSLCFQLTREGLTGYRETNLDVV